MSWVMCESYAVQLRPTVDVLVVPYSVRLILHLVKRRTVVFCQNSLFQTQRYAGWCRNATETDWERQKCFLSRCCHVLTFNGLDDGLWLWSNGEMNLTDENLVQLFTTQNFTRNGLEKNPSFNRLRIRRVRAWAMKRGSKTRNKADWRPMNRDIRWHGKENIIKIGRNTLTL